MDNSLDTAEFPLTDSMIKNFIEPGFIPDISVLQDSMPGVHGPYLEILEQPKQRGFRFRYPCEGPSHGGLPGEHSTKNKKSFPSVQIVGYNGVARIAVSLVSAESPYLPHAHSLVGKHCQKGVCTVEVGPNTGMTASFQNLGIEHVTKKNVVKVLMERYIEAQKLQTATMSALVNGDIEPGPSSLDMFIENTVNIGQNAEFDKDVAAAVAEEEAAKIRRLADEQAKKMNLSVVRLCFQAYLPGVNGAFTKTLHPVVSNEVYDSKAPSSSQLKICRVDKNAGSAGGGDEIFLLCDKVQRDDIEVRFYEEDLNGEESWFANAVFSPTDVHRQFAIVFKTPPYKDTAIQTPVGVFLELRRKNCKDRSDPFKFTYTPITFDNEQIGAKRRKVIPHFQDYFGGGGGGAGMGGAGAGGGGSGGGLMAFGSMPVDFLSGFTFGASGGGFSGGNQQGVSETDKQPAGENAHELLKSAIQKQAMYSMLALNLAVRSSNAMRMFASTGDVCYMLAVQQHLTAVQDEDGDSALHLAIINCQSHVVENLLAVMADLPKSYISQYNYLRQTPLHLAVITRQAHVVKKLLDAGADALLPDRHGNMPVHIACSNKDEGCLQSLLRRNNTNVNSRETKFIELDTHNYEGLTAVHLAVQSGSKSIVRMLCENQADVNTQERKFGKTPLHIAVETQNLVLAAYLILDAKCDIDAIDYDGNTALHVASGRGFKDVTALLVAAGANTDAENSMEEKPLHLAYKSDVKNILVCDDDPEFQKDEKIETRPPLSQSPEDCKKNITEASAGDSGFESYSAEKIPTESEGDMERVDHYLRYKMSLLLDVTREDGMDWKLLTKKLQLGSMAKAFAIQPSPTAELFNNYEACGGTVEKLVQSLVEMKRDDVLVFLNEVIGTTPKSEPIVSQAQPSDSKLSADLRLDSGLGSLEKRSEDSFSSLPPEMTQLNKEALLKFQHGRTDVH